METKDNLVLVDLKELITTVQEEVKSFSKSSEYSLSSVFQNALKDAFSDYTFYYYERTLRVGTPSGQNIYVSNQSFALARRLMTYCEAIGKYRSVARDILYKNQDSLKRIVNSNGRLEDDVFTELRDQKNDALKSEFEIETRTYFQEVGIENPELVDTNTERLIRFVTDYQWWLGGKQISRSNDWAISPISTLLNLPQNDSNFVARAVSRATEDSDYREAFEQAIEREWTDSEKEATQTVVYKTGLKSKYERNRILFGAPGTGKSFTLNRERQDLLGADNSTDYERVTFHPDYSYANFVGTYKPVMVGNTTLSGDKDVDFVISILNDKSKNAQEKYDLLFETFKGEGLTRLPILLGVYTDELFKTRKVDGSDAANDNSVERNHGRAIRKYVAPLTGEEKNGDIAYEYVPGPFMRVYVNALRNARSGNPRPFLLIIEEINRANVASVFGDVFQLLDRDEDQVSEYPIQASEDIKKYLAKELGGKPEDYSRIRIPDNMFIWATMNSADQGVFPMDTAFKRRWDFTYLGIDDSDNDIRGKYVTIGTKERQRFEWNELRKAINDFLANEKINEDKQLGPYFIPRNVVVPADGGTEIDSERFCDVFKHKVLMYLFDDAAKQKRIKIFEGSAKGQTRYSKICEAFDEQGIGIFHSDIQSRVSIQDLLVNEHEVDEKGMIKTGEENGSEE